MYTPERYQTIISTVNTVLADFNGRYKAYHIVNEESLWLEIVDETIDNLVDSIRTKNGDIILFDYDEDANYDDSEMQEALQKVDGTQVGRMLDEAFSEVLTKLTPKRRYDESDPNIELRIKRWCRQALAQADKCTETGSYLKPYIKYRTGEATE